MKRLCVATTIVTLALGSWAIAQQAKSHVMIRATDLQWQKAPPELPSGAEVAAIDGDMNKPEMFTIRVRVPDGWVIKPHFHPKDEHITVLSGHFWMGKGDRFDKAALHDLGPGAYADMPAGMHHFAEARGETVFQLTNMGPWGITYVNPNDDPRVKRSSR